MRSLRAIALCARRIDVRLRRRARLGAGGAGLSQQADSHGDRVSAGRDLGLRRPRGRRQDVAVPRPADRHREQAGGDGTHRHAVCPAVGAGRLHALACAVGLHARAGAAAQASVRPGEGLRGHRALHQLPARPGGVPGAARQQREGADRARQGEARPAQLRVRRQRRIQSHLGCCVRVRRGHRPHARAVQGQRSGDHRSSRRSRAAAVHLHRSRGRAPEGGQAQGHRGDRARSASRRCPTSPR